MTGSGQGLESPHTITHLMAAKLLPGTLSNTPYRTTPAPAPTPTLCPHLMAAKFLPGTLSNTGRRFSSDSASQGGSRGWE